LTVNAVGVDLEQDGDAMPGAARRGGRPRWREPRSSATARSPVPQAIGGDGGAETVLAGYASWARASPRRRVGYSATA
jgi:hypothetical protein